MLPNPVRHPAVELRVQHARGLADPFGRKAPAREGLPQRDRPATVREPSYQLKPMPFRTFGDLAEAALLLEVGCVGCRSRQVVTIGESRARRVFGRAHFVCSAMRPGLGTCRGPGVPQLVHALPIDRRLRFVTLTCPRCVPPWTARDVVLNAPPWDAAPIDPATERYRCPACGGQVRATFHGKPADGEVIAGHLSNPKDSPL